MTQCSCGCKHEKSQCPMCGKEIRQGEYTYSTQPTIRVVRDSKKGREVVANVSFAKGDIIEQCPVICISETDQLQALQGTILNEFVYPWTGFQPEAAAVGHMLRGVTRDMSRVIALGYGSLYNHSDDPNAIWEPDHKNWNLIIRAYRDIQPNDPIEVSYWQGHRKGGWEPNLKQARIEKRKLGWK